MGVASVLSRVLWQSMHISTGKLSSCVYMRQRQLSLSLYSRAILKSGRNMAFGRRCMTDWLATLLGRVSVGSGNQPGDDTLLLQPTEPYCHSSAYVCVSRKV